MTTTPRILHCHADFAAGEQQRLCVRLMNAFGRKIEHIVISEASEKLDARALIDKSVTARFPTSFPSFSGKPAPGRLASIAQSLKGYDLVCTYGWGAINVALAHTMFAENLGLPPLVHHETGLDPDDVQERKIGRNWYRRIALGRTAALVVESAAVEELALDKWKQPRARVQRIAPGVDTKAYAKKPKSTALRVVKREGEHWVGVVAALEPRNRLPELVQAFRDLPEQWQLVILGDGPAKPEILKAAEKNEIEHRVHLPGSVDDLSQVMGLFDVFGSAALDRGFPKTMVKAMAAGVPIAAPDIGEVSATAAEENGLYIRAAGDSVALARSLADLSADVGIRKAVGSANREKARAQFDEGSMIDTYRALYSEVMGRKL